MFGPKGILAMRQPLVSGTFRLEEAIPQEDAIEDAANVSLPLMSLYKQTSRQCLSLPLDRHSLIAG